MSDILGERNLEQRLTEIRAAIERMDFRWDQGFITDKADYLEKRVKLQQEFEQLSPIPDHDLERAADILTNFRHYWEACNGDFEEQHRLIKVIVERVYVQDEDVVAMTLKADYHVVLGNKANEPTQVSVDSSVYMCGDDGCCPLPRHVLFSPSNANYQPLIRLLFQLLDLPLKIPDIRQPRKTSVTPKRKRQSA